MLVSSDGLLGGNQNFDKHRTVPPLLFTMKKNIFFLIMLFLPIVAKGAYSGSCGTNVSYSFDVSSMTLTISGTGTMSNSITQPWASFRDAIKKVVIEEGVTSVGNYAFQMCDDLKSVTLSNSIIQIGSSAFQYCGSLTSINLPDGLESIGSLAFSGTNLKSVNIPSSVKTIGKSVFSGCDKLEKVIICDNITSIPENAFWHCSNLSSVSLGKNIKDIGRSAFDGCGNLTKIVLPPSCSSLGSSVFNMTGLKDVYCYAEEIPSTGFDTFKNINLAEATLHVSESEIPLYKAISPWNQFGKIVALTKEETGIEAATIDGNDIENYYSLDGKFLDEPHQGINIIKTADGQIKKIYVK